MTLEETKAYFDSFICEVLTSSPNNKKEIQDFSCEIRSNNLENYLKENAWEVDKSGETRVYIIREPKNKNIVFFFSLRCGIAFTTYSLDDDYRALSGAEKAYVNMLIEARKQHDDVAFYSLLEQGKSVFNKSSSHLQRIAEHRAAIKNEINEVNDARNVMNVFECYSSIEIQHLCRSDTFKTDGDIAYPLGFGLFWCKIVPLVLDISKMIGCEYLYLFAADRSDNPDDKKLVSYYKGALGFHDLDDDGVIVLKPDYDNNCIGLLQSVQYLKTEKDFIWEEFADHAQESQ